MAKATGREFWRAIAAETINITTNLKMYEDPNGEIVDLDTNLALSLAGTQEWGPKDPLPTSQRERPVHSTLFEIRTEPKLRPHVHTNAATYGVDCIEAPTLREIGAELILIPVRKELGSTTEILRQRGLPT
jgi:hypothetical protein